MAKTRKHRESGGVLCLASFDLEDSELIQVVIETPKSGRNKYAFDPDQNIFTLTKILPAGTIFPDDFGFVPSTTAEDGDPVDVLVLMDGTVFPGCLLRCRRIGIIEGEQGKRKETRRNDRIIALEQAKHTYELVKHAQDLGEEFVHELEEFFVNDHELTSKKYRILDIKGPSQARRRWKDGIRAFRKSKRRQSFRQA